MKNIYTFLLVFGCLLLSYTQSFAQPQGFNYQSVIRRTDGSLMKNKNLDVQVTILSGLTQAGATPVYQEKHNITSSNLGIVNFVVGSGTSTGVGAFNAIPWAIDNKYIRIEVDTTASNSTYVTIGTNQLMSVPFALYSPNSGSGNNGKNALINSIVEPPSANCTGGGIKLESGLDLNNNGVLDAAEITYTSFVCNGINGTNGTNGISISNVASNGDSLIITYSDASTQTLADVLKAGSQGPAGATGAQGVAGTNGISISNVATNGDSLIITYSDASTQTLADVLKAGPQGPVGATG
ncbi:MAG: hypothetical protein IT239_05360, partial [Bacteroidia bacterium]|nr:hypothetical protein [Bacteroidia bacterium]